MTCVCDGCSAGVNTCLVGHLCANCVNKLKRTKNLKKLKELFPMTASMQKIAKNLDLSEEVYHNFYILEICDDICRYLRSLPS